MLIDRTTARAPEPCACTGVDRPGRFECSLAFEDATIDAAAIYCSDGRFGAHFDDFLGQHLELVRCDRIVVPGGPVSLAGRPGLYDQQLELESQLRFLIEAHALRQVVLIAHSHCGFYQRRLGFAGGRLAEVQREDLARAASRVRRLGPVEVSAFTATMADTRVGFEPAFDRLR